MSQAGAAVWLNGLASSNPGRYPRGSHDSFHAALPEGEENRTPPSVRRAAARRQVPPIESSPDRWVRLRTPKFSLLGASCCETGPVRHMCEYNTNSRRPASLG